MLTCEVFQNMEIIYFSALLICFLDLILLFIEIPETNGCQTVQDAMTFYY